MMKTMMAAAVATGVAFAVSAAPTDFLRQQAYAEMQRVSGQIDTLQANHDDLAAKVEALADSGREVESLKAEVSALKSEMASMRRDFAAFRDTVVRELSRREAAAVAQPAAPSSYREYIVKPGDTLSVIARALNTTVAKIKAMNSLKSDNVRIGQKLKIPMD